ncbi:MAG: hypothetical protein Q9228_002472 [Teloschistes exilis]
MLISLVGLLCFGAASLAFPAEQLSRRANSTPPTSTPPAGTLSDCLGKKNVPIRLTSSSDFAALAKPYNLRLPYTPAVIVLPTTTQHVSDAVVCAGQNNVKVQARSGGHSYASFGLGGQSGSMVIDLENFQTISLDANKVATVGGGVRLGNLANGIYNQAQRALPHGTCPGVGVGGHATHGGFGLSSRAWGLTLDTIVGLDVVLANGSFIHATSSAYPDIYYALRGAADSFGIVTAFYLQTQPAPSSVVQWGYSIPNMFKSASQSATYFSHIQSFAQNASVVDRNLGIGIYMDGSGFSISGTYFGPLATFNSKIAPELLRTLPTPTKSSAQSMTWIQSLTALANGQPLQQPTTGYDLHDDFFAKSLVVPTSQPFTQATLTSYFDYIIKNGVNAANPWYSIINLYGGPDSQINNKPASFSSAYSDRTALWVLQHYGYTGNTGVPFPQGIVPFVEGLSNSITKAQPGTVFPGYANYVDPSLSAEEAHKAYFDEATYGRLVAIKGKVDPGKVFWNPQAVGT